MKKEDFIPYERPILKDEELRINSELFLNNMSSRRSVRTFSPNTIPKKVIENIIKTASLAPSGANKQPWTYAVISDPLLKKEIRIAAEQEEEINYNGRMSEEWLEDLKPFGTNASKPFLEIAPYLIVVFKKSYDITADGKAKNYYVNESVGLSAGFLIAAIHQAGLSCLTHTPSPLNFLEKILKRPANEKAVLLIPVGFAAEDAKVPNISKKPLKDISVWFE